MTRELGFMLAAAFVVAAAYFSWRLAMRQHREQMIGNEAAYSRLALPMWVYVVVPAGIALLGFAIGQVWRGTGMPAVLGFTGLWMTYVIGSRGRRMNRG